MKTASYLPHEALKPFVQSYIYVKQNSEELMHEIDLYPVGYGLLSFILNDNHQLLSLNKNYVGRLNYTGQLEEYRRIQASPLSVIYVLFKPFGAYKLFGIPQNLTKNDSFQLVDLIGNNANEIYNQLIDCANDPETAIRVMEIWLLRQLAINEKIDVSRIRRACQEIMLNKGNISIQEINKRCGISKSSMENHFKQQVGVSPKLFSRIIRFTESKKLLNRVGIDNWIEIIDRQGYYDQSHFIHEFKYFFGYSPSQMQHSQINLANKIVETNLSKNHQLT